MSPNHGGVHPLNKPVKKELDGKRSFMGFYEKLESCVNTLFNTVTLNGLPTFSYLFFTSKSLFILEIFQFLLSIFGHFMNGLIRKLR